jgi:patatin-related protein
LFALIFGSLSSIPREQPIRDNLEQLANQSRDMARLRAIVAALRPDIDKTVEKLFGHTLFLDRPSLRRLTAWRAKAQTAAAKQAGFAFDGYAQVKFTGIVDELAQLIASANPQCPNASQIEQILTDHLRAAGLADLRGARGGASPQAITFFRTYDLQHRIRRLRQLARLLTEGWDNASVVADTAREAARDAVYQAMALYFAREPLNLLGPQFPDLAMHVADDPAAVLNHIAQCRDLAAVDHAADQILSDALIAMPVELRRKVLLAYLGFPFYDAVTLPLLRNAVQGEFEPVKVDRISPDDCASIRKGGAAATLRGVEFFNFGAFFSRAYRENDYLWGRLHGAERMIDLVASALPEGQAIDHATLTTFKREAFLAILDEEQTKLLADPGLVPGIRCEVEAIKP